ncbi:hypothetical protein diail_7909 [Diaporthe ilicicola]|nr:hypothetical protein diail_7909 [Diaporthe ilicicola]
MQALTNFRMDMVPNFNFAPNQPGGGDVASEVAESVDAWFDELCRNGNTGEQAAEIINSFQADMEAAEAAMAGDPVGIESVADAAAGKVFSNPAQANSFGVQAAAQVASIPGVSAGKISDALLKAGVPADAVASTTEAVLHTVKQAPKGWIGRPAFNAALGVISASVTSAGVAGAEAAKAAVDGASGPGLAGSLGAAGVPASAADATAAAMGEAIQAAKASGSEPVLAAINVIQNAASPAGQAAAAAVDGASGGSLAPALAAAGVSTSAMGATVDAVAAAVSAAGGSGSAALKAAADIIASAASPKYEQMNSPAPPVSPAQAALDAVGASYNFWHVAPYIVWQTLKDLKGNTTDSADLEGLTELLANGPPPTDWPSRFVTFPYRRGGNRVTGLPPVPTASPRPTPSGTNNGNKASAPTLKPAPPGTGGYLHDGTTPGPHSSTKTTCRKDTKGKIVCITDVQDVS